MKEVRTPLGEKLFTQICKTGNMLHGLGYDSTDVRFTKADIIKLASGEILEKSENDKKFMYLLEDFGKDLTKEIIKRSPIYSELYYEL